MMGEIGATEGWARFNLMLAVGMVREAAALTTQIGGEVIPSDKPGCIAMALREPVGVMLGIAPWNAPIILGVRAIAVPLACGNTVILKASEQCPRTHALIVEAFAEAGFRDGIVNLVTNAPEDAGEVVGALIDHPAVRRINFTGSTAVGRIIAKRAAEHLKPVLLELGGKAPLIVLEDADLDEAVKAAAFGAFMNQGQICMSTERIIVVDSVADAFVAKFAAKVGTMPVGDPREGKTPLGAVVDRKTVDCMCSADRRCASARAPSRLNRRRRRRRADARARDRQGHARHEAVPRRELRPGRRRSSARATRRMRSSWPTTPNTACPPRSSPATPRAACASRARSSRASATSTARPCMTRRRCRSAASRPRAMAASAARPGSTPSPSCAGSRSRPSPAIIRSETPAHPSSQRTPDRQRRSGLARAMSRVMTISNGRRRLRVDGPHRLGEVQPPRQAQLHEPQAQPPT